jgi:putative ABC transport system permease protein
MAWSGVEDWRREFLRELRNGARSLRRSPRFALAAILTLGVGIGAATAIFSVVDAVLLRPLPFRESGQLVSVVRHEPPTRPGGPTRERRFTRQEFEQWRVGTRTLSDVAATTASIAYVRTSHGTVRLWGGMVSTNTFSVLGTQAWMGRVLLPSDDGGPDVVVLSHDAWRLSLQADAAIVGKAIEFLDANGSARAVTVVGVMPADFALPGQRMEFFVPIRPGDAALTEGPRYELLGRLRPDTTFAAARHDAAAVGAALPARTSDRTSVMSGLRFDVRGLKDHAVRTLRPALRIFFAAVAALLLIVCVNVANLLLARGAGRHREIAVRAALGASRGRIVRGLIAEGLVLAAVGGLVGAALGTVGVALVRQLATVEAPGVFALMFGESILPRAHEIAVDVRVLGIALGVSALTALLVAVPPALRTSRVQPMRAFGGRGDIGSRGAARIRSLLVVAQVALATVLLIAAGLLIHSFARLSAVDRGYRSAGTVVFQLVFPPASTVARQSDAIETILSRLRASPEVVAVGFARHGVLIGEQITLGHFAADGLTAQERPEQPTPAIRPVSGGYLTAVGARFAQGRDLRAEDGGATPGIVISRGTSRAFAPHGEVGQYVEWHWRQQHVRFRIVGIVDDVRNEGADGAPTPEVFVDYRVMLRIQERLGDAPIWQRERALGFLSFAVRTRDDPRRATAVVTRVVRDVDPGAGIDGMLPLERLVASSVAGPRFQAVLLAAFAGVAGLLAAIGIYGVLAYTVEQRTQEIGVRMALGAHRRQVLGLVLRRGLTLMLTGLILGTAMAAAGARLLEALLFGVTPVDAATYGSVLVLFLLVGLLAAYFPARRATRVDPLAALAAE